MVQRNKPSDCLRPPLIDTMPTKCQQLKKGYGECKRGMVDMRKRFRGNQPIAVSKEIEGGAQDPGNQLYAGKPAFSSTAKETSGTEPIEKDWRELENEKFRKGLWVAMIWFGTGVWTQHELYSRTITALHLRKSIAWEALSGIRQDTHCSYLISDLQRKVKFPRRSAVLNSGQRVTPRQNHLVSSKSVPTGTTSRTAWAVVTPTTQGVPGVRCQLCWRHRRLQIFYSVGMGFGIFQWDFDHPCPSAIWRLWHYPHQPPRYQQLLMRY